MLEVVHALRRPQWALLLVAACAGLGATAEAAEPIGAARCGACHEAIYASWQKTAHARSLQSLSEGQQRDPTCRACHTLAPTSDDPELAGVQCESCHGEGSEYAPAAVMRDPRLARMLGLEDVTAEQCRFCHEGVDLRLSPLDYRAWVKAMGHGK